METSEKPWASSVALMALTRPSIMSEGAMMSAPDQAGYIRALPLPRFGAWTDSQNLLVLGWPLPHGIHSLDAICTSYMHPISRVRPCVPTSGHLSRHSRIPSFPNGLVLYD